MADTDDAAEEDNHRIAGTDADCEKVRRNHYPPVHPVLRMGGNSRCQSVVAVNEAQDKNHRALEQGQAETRDSESENECERERGEKKKKEEWHKTTKRQTRRCRVRLHPAIRIEI